MAKFRTYKNGITGLRYQGYFIVSNEANPDKFDIIDENHYPLVQLYDSIEECKWYLDKYTATPEQKEMIEQLATMEIYELNHRMMELFRKNEGKRMDKATRHELDIVTTVRNRKVSDNELN